MNTPTATRNGSTVRALAGFLAVQLLLALLLFRDALWGGSLLAPLDIAPALLSEFKAVDPAREVPDNHYILDQLVYDLPLQRTLHAAVRRGEVPWWDPYTFGGRPLLADAHVFIQGYRPGGLQALGYGPLALARQLLEGA